MGDLNAAVEAVMQQIITLNERWAGDYILVAESGCTEDGTMTRFSWFYKPPGARSAGPVMMMAMPPGYQPEDPPAR